MNQLDFESSTWYSAISLTERIAVLHNGINETRNSNIDTELAQRRIEKWKSQNPFTTESVFAQRLAMDGIKEEEFLVLLGESAEVLRSRCPNIPVWLVELTQAFMHSNYSKDWSIVESEELEKHKQIGFLFAIEPLIDRGFENLDAGIQKLMITQAHLPFDSSAISKLLFDNLKNQLLMLLTRTMVLELNIARLQGVLHGDTSESRFESFLERLKQPELVIPILEEYPVLARQIIICIDRWVNFSLEFLQHLCADWQDIRTTLSPDSDPGILTEIHSGVGDTHRGGRSVIIAKFSSGFQVVYKPNSLAVDLHFQQLLEWLNQRSNLPPFRTLKVLSRNHYGWVEFVSAKECTTSEEVYRFYQRQGAYLGLLYAMEATDFHHENLIAVGEHPVLVDLEALFHPRAEGLDRKKADHLAMETMGYSVLRIGLLPQRIWANAESDGVEISGLGGKAGQLSPNPVKYLAGVGTDEMRIERERKPISGSNNLPRLNDNEVDVLEYTEAIIDGFSSIYRLLLQYRQVLLAENSPLASFYEDRVRFIVRDTNTYATILHESYHPDLLRNALDRDRFFDRLWLQVEHAPHLEKVIPAERQDFWNGDIPIFSTRPNSRDLWTSTGEKIPDFFDASGMTLVCDRLQKLTEDDLKQQLWFIQASLTTLAMVGEGGKWPSYKFSEPKQTVSRETLLAAAEAVGDRLESLALKGEEDISWIGVMLMHQKHWTLTPANIDLYNGLPGIILFLAYLGMVTEKERYTVLAKRALITLQSQIETNKISMISIGGFDGWGGIIYTLTHLGIIWQDVNLLKQAEDLVELLPDLIAQDESLDIIAGAAGCLASLIALYHCRPSQSTLTAAVQCGDRIIAHAETEGMGWLKEKPTGEKPLSGFSHGAAGMAAMLLTLAALTGEKRFHKASLAAIAYERSLFCSDIQGWASTRYLGSQITGSDLEYFPNAILAKTEGQQYVCLHSWCHGAPGIGLGRLLAIAYLDDLHIRAEIHTAVNNTIKNGFGYNHSLCHGDLGNLELLLKASEIIGHPQWRAEVDRFAAIILESIDRHGWLCGVPLGVETPGLMTGLAGIGYGLMRLAAPDIVPSVLAMQPPNLSTSEVLTRQNSALLK